MKTKPDPNVIKNRFDLAEGDSPALLRPLTQDEQDAVALFIMYYRRVIYPSTKSVIDHMVPFKQVLENAGINVEGYRTKGGRGLFKGLFRYAPDLPTYTAIRRVVGFTVDLTPDEKRLVFRAAVKMYQDIEGNGPESLPGEKYFKELYENREFIEAIGMVMPNAGVFYYEYKSRNETLKAKWRDLFSLYFDIPDEISNEVLQKNFPIYSLDDLIENYLEVNEWLHEQNPDLDPSYTPRVEDVTRYAEEQGGIPWSVYTYALDRRNVNRPAIGGLNELRETAGLQPNPDTVNRGPQRLEITRYSQFSKEELFEGYVAAWQFLSPESNFALGEIFDPPRHFELLLITGKQTKILNELGSELPLISPEVARKNGVPEIIIPSFAAMQRNYPGGVHGLMRDVEDRFCIPNDRTVEFSSDRQGQLAMLTSRAIFLGKDPSRVLRAVSEKFGLVAAR